LSGSVTSAPPSISIGVSAGVVTTLSEAFGPLSSVTIIVTMPVSKLPYSKSKDIRVPRSRTSKNSKFTRSFAIVDDGKFKFKARSEFGPNQDQFNDRDYVNGNDRCEALWAL